MLIRYLVLLVEFFSRGHLSQTASQQAADYEWHYALLAVQARNDDNDDHCSNSGRLQWQCTNSDTNPGMRTESELVKSKLRETVGMNTHC